MSFQNTIYRKYIYIVKFWYLPYIDEICWTLFNLKTEPPKLPTKSLPTLLQTKSKMDKRMSASDTQKPDNLYKQLHSIAYAYVDSPHKYSEYIMIYHATVVPLQTLHEKFKWNVVKMARAIRQSCSKTVSALLCSALQVPWMSSMLLCLPWTWKKIMLSPQLQQNKHTLKISNSKHCAERFKFVPFVY